ncbi:MAG: DUF3105 domain-containing protein [Chloroflexi bacterium]|nr:MAG: DUF3105 domain-containing protein [Chloroflexota bacterium]
MTVTTRRERRQQQRRQQQRRDTGGGGSRGIGGLWIGVIVIAAVIALLLVARQMGFLEGPSAANTIDVNSVDVSQTVGEKQNDLGHEHVSSGQRVNYPSLPPTSGQHWPSPAAPAPWGIKTSTLPFEVSTHNLEHGGVVIYYAADTSSAQVDQMRALVRSLQSAGFNKIVLEPWADMPKESKVILTAWDWILKQPTFDQILFVKFVRQHHAGSDAPEANIP